MAAIYQEWTDQDTGEIVETVAVTTAPANPLMEQVHNSKKRMPTILNDELAYEWIGQDTADRCPALRTEKEINKAWLNPHHVFPD